MLQRTPGFTTDEQIAPGAAARRMVFASLVALTIASLLMLAAATLSAGGFDIVDGVLLGLFMLTTPWTVVGFWNAAIGFVLARFAGAQRAELFLDIGRALPVATTSTAILVCIRNEDPQRVLRNVGAMLQEIYNTGQGDLFHVYILSDTSFPGLDAIEQERFECLAQEWHGRMALTYRRRETNTNYKAGNIADFCARWGGAHEFALVLDADSVMSADTILRLVALAEEDPRIGILQSLVVGLPSTSAFTRIFQFGMRLGMRSYTLGSAWWQGECGPYWGHNAIIRLRPFMQHAQLPAPAAGESPILSHDQIEAVLMRRGGLHVRVVAQESESFEENPPNLVAFLQRDSRWCRGNMQYWRFLLMPALKPTSRCQLLLAILMFVGSPGWIGLAGVGAAALALAQSPAEIVHAEAGLALFVVVLLMWFAPKIATVADIVSRPAAARPFGGRARFLLSVAIEIVFFTLLSPILWMNHVLLFAAAAFGKGQDWAGQIRDDHVVSLGQALRLFWPHTLFGTICLGLVTATHPGALPYALVLFGGLALSIPLAVLTSLPGVGHALIRWRIALLPEEIATPPIVKALHLPALGG